LKEKFNNAVSIQTLKTVVESHQLVGVLKDDLRDIKVTLVAQADAQADRVNEGKSSRFTSVSVTSRMSQNGWTSYPDPRMQHMIGAYSAFQGHALPY
jgi:hypothetical protein